MGQPTIRYRESWSDDPHADQLRHLERTDLAERCAGLAFANDGGRPEKVYAGRREGAVAAGAAQRNPGELVVDVNTRAGTDTIVTQTRAVPLVHLVAHSPTGIECGYAGSGPADLALSLVFDVLEPAIADEDRRMRLAWRFHQRVKFALVVDLPQAGTWSITERQVLEAILTEAGPVA